ncbi:MAG: ATP-binding protein [Rhodospirillales bacterium]
MSGRVVNPPKRGWRRLLPRSLMGQLVLVLAVAFLLVQAITLAISAGERRFALHALHQDEMISRTVSTYRVLTETPAGLQDRILEAATSGPVRFWVADTGAVSRDDGRVVDNRLARRLHRTLNLPDDRAVRVDIREVEYGWFRNAKRHDDDEDDDDDDDDHRWSRHHGPSSLLISVELADGRWLNAENVFRGPTSGRKWGAFIVMTLLVLGVSLASMVLVRRIIRPMKDLAAAADRMGRGETVAPLDETGPREARDTIRAFNEMSARLKRFIDDRTHMLAATGHDLRTPLTSLRLRAELVDDEDLKAKMLATIDEMTRMVEAMLAFAREDAVSEEARDVDVTAMVGSIVADLQDLGLRAELADGSRVVHRCRPVSLTRALRNLIENAARHGRGARISLKDNADALRVVIADDGPGIPDDKIEHVFEPFARLDDARNRETGSMGLGLAIARSIVRSHGGDISLSNRPEGGLRAEVMLPRG